MRTKNIFYELNLFLGSQPICIVGFGFPTMGDSLPRDLTTHSRLYKLHSFFLFKLLSLMLILLSFALLSLQNCQPLHLSPYLPFYSWR